MKFIKWILGHKKSLLSVLALGGMFYVGIVNLIPGDQGEALVTKIAEKTQVVADGLPDDPLAVEPTPEPTAAIAPSGETE